MRTIVSACKEGGLHAEPVVVFSNNGKSEALKWAAEQGLERMHVSSKTHSDADQMYETIREKLTEHNISHILLSGYMRLLDPRIVQSFPNRTLNIHPALLPKFGGKGMYGMHVHQAVIEAGETLSGVTIHIVNEHYDEGPIVAQTLVSVEKDDTPETLRERVASSEKELFVSILAQLQSGEIDLDRIASEKQQPIILEL